MKKVLILTNDLCRPRLERTIFDCLRIKGDFSIVYDINRNYDVGISFMHLQKIPKEHLSKPWINFHPAPLPEYKGRNLCYHAIMNGETEFGASVHYVDENFDTGKIIEVIRFPIFIWDTSETIYLTVMEKSYLLFEKYFLRFVDGEEFPAIDNVGGTYYKKEPISDFIDPTKDIKRQIRAITFGDFYPKISVGGRTYKIVRDE